MKLYLVYFGNRFEGGGLQGIYLNRINAIKRAMRRVYQELRYDAKKVPDKWEWYDDYDFVAVKEEEPNDVKDLTGDSFIPLFMRYKDFLENIPVKELEELSKQSLNRKKLRDALSRRDKRRSTWKML